MSFYKLKLSLIYLSDRSVATVKKAKKKREGRRDKDKELASSLIVACLKRLLPIGLNLFAGREQELVQHAKEKFLKKEQEQDISEYIKIQLTLPDKIDPSDSMSWQHYLYSKLGQQQNDGRKGNEIAVVDLSKQKEIAMAHHHLSDQLIERIIDMAKVLYGLHMVIKLNFYYLFLFLLIFFLFRLIILLLGKKVFIEVVFQHSVNVL